MAHRSTVCPGLKTWVKSSSRNCVVWIPGSLVLAACRCGEADKRCTCLVLQQWWHRGLSVLIHCRFGGIKSLCPSGPGTYWPDVLQGAAYRTAPHFTWFCSVRVTVCYASSELGGGGVPCRCLCCTYRATKAHTSPYAGNPLCWAVKACSCNSRSNKLPSVIISL